MTPEDFLTESARFWSRVDRSGECWLWLGEKNNMGYGRHTFWHDGKRTRVFAHRLALALTGVPLPTDKVCRHTCDTPACVRPDHIIGGTQADNIHDAMARGRMDTHGLQMQVDGLCRHCGAKFTGSPNRRYCHAHSRYKERVA